MRASALARLPPPWPATGSGAMNDARLLGYDTARFPFASLAARALQVEDLSALHEHRCDPGRPPSYAANVRLRQELRARLETTPFFSYYNALVHIVVAPLFGLKVSYSRRPQFRVHLTGSPSASGWHTDQQVTGRDDQINIWLPFGSTCPANTLWVETDYGRGDYTPVTVEHGQMLLFDGGLLSHGTVENTSRQTRVSMDLRFTPLVPGVLEGFFPGRASLADRARLANGRPGPATEGIARKGGTVQKESAASYPTQLRDSLNDSAAR
jgi:hypothetical protein